MNFFDDLARFCYQFIYRANFVINASYYNAILTTFEKHNMVVDSGINSMDEKLLAIYLVLNGKASKTNGILFVGPPGAGKSLFMEVLASDFQRIGNFNILNFKSEFALDDLANADIAIGDEIIFKNMNMANYFNLLLEGSSNLKISIKNKDKIPLKRIHVMVAGNTYPWHYTSKKFV